MQRKRNTNNKPDYKGKERYKKEKNTIYKKKEEKKPKQREVK
jgi:hypothetical protein